METVDFLFLFKEETVEAIKISTLSGRPEDMRTGALLVGVFEKPKRTPKELKVLDKAAGGALERLIKSGDFSAKMGQCAWIYPSGATFKRLLAVGLGARDKFSPEAFRRAIGFAAREVRRIKSSDAVVALPEGSGADFPGVGDLARAAVEGFIMGAYKFLDYKSKTENSGKIKKFTIVSSAEGGELTRVRRGAEHGAVIAEAVTLARDLANTPGNDLPPEGVARVARIQARKYGLRCKVLGVPQLKRINMNALLAVGSGSSRPPRLVILEYRPKGAPTKKPPLMFVGKGITFDSGGISIKPSANMDQMKYDMSGAAAVMAALVVAARREWNRPVVGIMPCAENLPSAKAYRPGDVVKTASGIRVEVLNTDAEGRMVLSDALHYANRYKPAAVVDLATLTGACVIALGHEAMGLMSRDDDLADKILAVGEACGERAWRLPLWEEYNEQIKSDVADIKNVGGRAAGTITAGAFLARFAKDYKWAHLDIAGTAWNERDWAYRIKGAAGAGVRILAELGEKY